MLTTDCRLNNREPVREGTFRHRRRASNQALRNVNQAERNRRHTGGVYYPGQLSSADGTRLENVDLWTLCQPKTLAAPKVNRSQWIHNLTIDRSSGARSADAKTFQLSDGQVTFT